MLTTYLTVKCEASVPLPVWLGAVICSYVGAGSKDALERDMVVSHQGGGEVTVRASLTLRTE